MTTPLKLDMEIWRRADTSVDYAVGAFWYARPGATHNRRRRPAEAAAPLRQAPAVPKVTRLPGAVEPDDAPIVARSEGVRAGVQNAGLYEGAWSAGKPLFVQAARPTWAPTAW